MKRISILLVTLFAFISPPTWANDEAAVEAAQKSVIAAKEALQAAEQALEAVLSATGSEGLEAMSAGGNLKCYSGKNGGGKVLKTMNSAHNCCTGKTSGKSWSCPSYDSGDAVNCSKNNSYHCP